MNIPALDQARLKEALKAALVEVLEERPDLLRGALIEALEDIALAHAIHEVEAHPEEAGEPVSRDEICRTLEEAG